MNVYEAIAVSDKSQGDSGWDDAHGLAVCTVLAHQLRYHVGPAYGLTSAPVHWCGTVDPPTNTWPIYLLRSPDVQGALGYHDVDNHGRPYGRVFTSVCRQAGVSIESCLSHETVEAFVDPFANDWSDKGSVSVAHEACDPVQGSSYHIAGVEVSNFVTRAYFDPLATSGQFDHLGHLTKPMSLEHGGYLIVMEDGAVTQRFGEVSPAAWRLNLHHAEQLSRFNWRAIRALVA